MLSVWLVLSLCLVVAVAVSIYAVVLAKRLVVVEQAAAQQVQALKHELAVVNSAAMGVGQRLIHVEKKLKLAMEKQQKMEMTNVDYLPYSHASIAGVDVDQLADRYGLPEAEANLLSLLKTAAK